MQSKRAKNVSTLHDFQYQAYREMLEAEKLQPNVTVHIAGREVVLNFRLKCGVLNLKPGSGKTAICLYRLCKWIEDGISITTPNNTLAIHPHLPFGLCGHPATCCGRYDPLTHTELRTQFVENQTFSDNLQGVVEKSIVGRQLRDLEYQWPQASRAGWPPGRVENCPCVISVGDASSHRCLGWDGSWVWDTCSLKYEDCKTSLVIVPPKLYRQWCEEIEKFVPPDLRKHFVTMATITKVPVEPTAGRTVYVLGRAQIDAWETLCCKPHDLVFQDEMHLKPSAYLKTLRYNFFWGISASVKKLDLRNEVKMSAWLTYSLHTLLANTWWDKEGGYVVRNMVCGMGASDAVVGLELARGFGDIYPQTLDKMFPSIGQEFETCPESSIPNVMERVLNPDTTEDFWGVRDCLQMFYGHGLGNIHCVGTSTQPEMIQPEWQVVSYRQPSVNVGDVDNREETFLQLSLLDPQTRRSRLLSMCKDKKLHAWVTAKLPGVFAEKTFEEIRRVLEEISLHGMLRVGAGTHQQLANWGVLNEPVAIFTRLYKLLPNPEELAEAGNCKHPKPQADQIAEWRQVLRELAASVLGALEELFVKTWQKDIEERLGGMCGICLDNASTNFPTSCCLQAICLPCALRIKETCPFCRHAWSTTVDAWRATKGTTLPTLPNVLYDMIGSIMRENPAAKILAITSLPENLPLTECVPPGVTHTTMTSYRMALRSIEEFKCRTSLLAMNERILNYGLNLQFVTHLLLLNKVSDETQVVGRVVRLGRTVPIKIYRFIPS